MKSVISARTVRFLVFVTVLIVMVVAGSWNSISPTYADGSRRPVPYTLERGYLDFSYGTSVIPDHTAERPESKLWWNDGFWWGSLWNDATESFHIYRLAWGSQTWEDTGVPIDDRPESRADVLWDAANQKLYVASHFKYDNPSTVNDPVHWARLYRFSYDQAAGSYTPDTGFPVTGINQDKTTALVLDKDSSGTLWASYVSRPQASDVYQVYINTSDGDDQTWHDPFSLYNLFPEARVAVDDLAAVVAFNNTVGIMWTNQLAGTLHFGLHKAGMPMSQGWTHTVVPIVGGIDDHLNLKANSAGQLFAAIKTTSLTPGEPLIAMVTRDTNGQYGFHTYSRVEANDTRPTLVINEGTDQVYMFVTGKPGGSKICYKKAAITAPLADMAFPPGDCGTDFIVDSTYDRIDSATTSKHPVNTVTGLVVVASDDHNGNVYVHNVVRNEVFLPVIVRP